MAADISRGSVPAIHPGLGAAAAGTWARALRLLGLAVVVAAERRQLAALDDRMLKDIGLSRSTAAREVARDFLDVPIGRILRR